LSRALDVAVELGWRVANRLPEGAGHRLVHPGRPGCELFVGKGERWSLVVARPEDRGIGDLRLAHRLADLTLIAVRR
jgi:hypothetical protein